MIAVAFATVLLFAAGVLLQAVGGSRENSAAEITGVLMWTSPAGIWVAFATSLGRAPVKQQLDVIRAGFVIGGSLVMIGGAALFAEGGLVFGAVLVGVSTLPLGLAIGTWRARSSNSIAGGQSRKAGRRLRHR